MEDEKGQGGLTHTDGDGRVSMVDVTEKPPTVRTARAGALVRMKPETLALVMEGRVKKGSVWETVKIAGIMAAKKTGELIPLCHPLAITHAGVEFFPDPETGIVRIEATATVTGPTGVEMEALTAVAVAALTLYDMVKAVDRAVVITDIRLLEKSGGRSGHYLADKDA